MKDHLANLVRETHNVQEGKNLVREYLQARILGVLQKCGAMIPLVFYGGTALRFLYSHGRFSEDLDFALEGNRESYDFQSYLRAIQSGFAAEGYALRVRMNDQKTVHSAFFGFQGLLNEMGLSPHRSEVLSIKIEVDTQPPRGAGLETSVVRRFVILNLQHHDKASLFAGKLHAILQRSYSNPTGTQSEGRDVYDLLWYTSNPERVEPNLVMLNNALEQTQWGGKVLTLENWREEVYYRLKKFDWEMIVEDVRPFVEPGFDLRLLDLKVFEKVLGEGKDDRGRES